MEHQLNILMNGRQPPKLERETMQPKTNKKLVCICMQYYPKTQQSHFQVWLDQYISCQYNWLIPSALENGISVLASVSYRVLCISVISVSAKYLLKYKDMLQIIGQNENIGG
jgi:hypothetical protein